VVCRGPTASGTVPESGVWWVDFAKRLIHWYVFFIQPLFLEKTGLKSGGKRRKERACLGPESSGFSPRSPDQIAAG